MRLLYALFVSPLLLGGFVSAAEERVISPDKKLTLIISDDGGLRYRVEFDLHNRRRLCVTNLIVAHVPGSRIDDAVAASYGQLAAAVVAAGRQPRARTLDLLIAATAHAHGARLYTRNPDDFRGLDDLVEVVTV